MRVRPDRRVAVAIAIAAALTAISIAGGGYGDVALSVTTAATWLALLALVLAGRIRAEAPPALVAAAAGALGLLALTGLSLTWASSDGAAFTEVVRTAGYLGVLLLAGLAAGRSRIGVIVAGISAAALAVAGIALVWRLVIASGGGGLESSLPSASGRLSYPIGYWNALGALMAIGLPGIAWLAATASDRRLRGLAMAAFSPPLLVAYMASSRGALVAAVLGIGITVAFAAARPRALATALVGVACVAPAVAAATLASGILDTDGGGSPGRAEAGVLVALAIGMAFAVLAGPAIAERLAASRVLRLRIPPAVWVGGLLVVAVAIVIVAASGGVGGGANPGQRTGGVVSTSGTGRSSFWGTAISAFSDEPIRGIGAGGYADYWNAHGDIAIAVHNAHSEPLEVLAELGVAGFACLALLYASVLFGGFTVARVRDGGPAAAAFGIVVAALVGFLIDWTWQFPAVAFPFLLAGGALAGAAPRPRSIRVPAAATAVGLAALAAGAIWASGVLGVSSSRIQTSEDAINAGRLDEAAVAARAAISIEPWASDPWLHLAEAEDLAGNEAAAFRASREAIRRAPDDYRAWLVAAQAQAGLGNSAGGDAYRERGMSIYPLSPSRG
jgi:O-antigen ligase